MWEEAHFVARPNRFTLLLRKNKKLISAYLPNTGRIEEYLTEGNVFFITPAKTEKFNYRVLSTVYQDSYVLLDTVKTHSLARTLLERRILPSLGGARTIRPEIRFNSAAMLQPGPRRASTASRVSGIGSGNVRVDFFIETHAGRQGLIEVKTCTFCHNGVALFPDAPSVRALRHLEALSDAGKSGYDPVMLFFIPSGAARLFLPNFHTDYEFSLRLLSEDRVRFIAVKINLVDPVSVDFKSVEEIPIDRTRAKMHCRGSGSYILLLKNPKPVRLEIGKRGMIHFRKGYYAYVGSALGSLEGRVNRHSRKKKKKFWHIDFLTPHPMKIIQVILFRRSDRIEDMIARRLESCFPTWVKGFGASDTKQPSHLFYSKDPPHRSHHFMNVVMDFKTFTE